MGKEKITHPTSEDLETFYHDRFTMKNIDWVATHIKRCGRCRRKFQKLKEKLRSRHKDIKFNHTYRSLDLLWIIRPQVAERMAICYAATTFVNWSLDIIETPADIEFYSAVLSMLKERDVRNPKKYLDYKNTDEAWAAFDYAAQWLVRMEIQQRFDLFVDLARMCIMSWYIPQKESPVYIKHDSIAHMASKLEIPHEIAWKKAEEELWDLQKYWMEREREKVRNNDPESRSMEVLLRTKPEVASRMIRCYSAILFVLEELSSISTLEEMEDHIEALKTLREFVGEASENDLAYKNDDEAYSAFKEAADWLRKMNVKERLWLFEKLMKLTGDRFMLHMTFITRITNLLTLFRDTLDLPKELFEKEIYRLKNMINEPAVTL